MSDSILVVVAHSDDEVLGCGGTIARHISNGDNVIVLFMTDGVSARPEQDSEESDIRSNAASNAMNILGVSDVRQYRFPDNKMDGVLLLDVVKVIEKVVQEIKPTVVYTHFLHDLNIDHQITHQAVMTCCRPQQSSSVKKILSFEVLSSTEWNSTSLPAFRPNYIVDISAYWDQKKRALECYADEMRTFPHSRSYKCVESLAVLRGASNGFEKAEAFHVERILIE